MPKFTAPPASVLLTPWQYLRFALLTGLAIDLLITPGLLSMPGMSLGHFAVQLGRALVFTAVIFGLNYYLRYSRTRTQRMPLPLPPRLGKLR